MSVKSSDVNIRAALGVMLIALSQRTRARTLIATSLDSKVCVPFHSDAAKLVLAAYVQGRSMTSILVSAG